MSNIVCLLMIVMLVDVFAVDGKTGFEEFEGNEVNFAFEMHRVFVDEVREIQNRLRLCRYNCTELQDFVESHLSHMSKTLQNLIDRLQALDGNVLECLTSGEGLQSTFQNFSKLYERQEASIVRVLKGHDHSSPKQDIRGVVAWPRDCADIREVGQKLSGVYRVYALGPDFLPVETSVYCDMNSSTSGEGWLVFQRRKDGSEDFKRTWVEYKNGFGNLRREFWLGNNALHLLTSNRDYKLRIELEDFEGNKRYAEYKQFAIGSASDNYRLSVSGYSGNAGDDMSVHSGHQFTTKDADHDSRRDTNCAVSYQGAWWYFSCHTANLNGLYLRGPHESYADGIEWKAFRGQQYSLKMTEMKIAPQN